MHVLPNDFKVWPFITLHEGAPLNVYIYRDVVGRLLPHPVERIVWRPMVVAFHVGCDEFQRAIFLIRDQTEFADVATCSSEQLEVNCANVFVAMSDMPLQDWSGPRGERSQQCKEGEEDGGNHICNVAVTKVDLVRRRENVLTLHRAQNSRVMTRKKGELPKKKNPAPTFRSGTNLTKLSLDA